MGVIYKHPLALIVGLVQDKATTNGVYNAEFSEGTEPVGSILKKAKASIHTLHGYWVQTGEGTVLDLLESIKAPSIGTFGFGGVGPPADMAGKHLSVGQIIPIHTVNSEISELGECSKCPPSMHLQAAMPPSLVIYSAGRGFDNSTYTSYSS